jgi:hypothetical protein
MKHYAITIDKITTETYYIKCDSDEVAKNKAINLGYENHHGLNIMDIKVVDIETEDTPDYPDDYEEVS